MSKLSDNLNLLIDKKVKQFPVINIGACFKFTREKIGSKLAEENSNTNFDELFNTFLTRLDKAAKNVELI